MTQLSIVGPGDGEILELGPGTRMRILEDGARTGHRLGIAEGVVAPRTPGPPQHRHAEHEEGFYVVSGVLRFTVGRDVHDAGAGTMVVVPPGVPHTFANPGDEPVRALTTFTPSRYVRYFRELRDAYASGNPSPADLAAIMGRYATVVSDEYAT